MLGMHPDIFKMKPVVFFTPGSGMGHLVRSSALCIELEAEGVPCVIITSSPFAEGFSGITGIVTFGIHTTQWQKKSVELLMQLSPSLVVIDTFPLGFKGEEFDGLSRNIPFIYLARRLKIQAYQKKLNRFFWSHAPHFSSTLITEPLSDDHYELIESVSETVTTLNGRIKFPAETICIPPVPVLLKQKIQSSEHLHLIVHSGPGNEVEALIRHAKASSDYNGNHTIAVINPFPTSSDTRDYFDYFPASTLYSNAFRIYSGAGYNSVAESQEQPDKHSFIPFDRFYDDQVARLNSFKPTTESGNRTAVLKICNLYNSC